MRLHFDRMWSLVSRYRVDRRLPPPVKALLASTLTLRLREAIEQRQRSVLPVLGRGPSVAALGPRRLATAGTLPVGLSDLRHDYGHALVTALAPTGIDSFLIDRRDDHLVFGVALEERDRAKRALAALDGAAWFVEVVDRSTTRLMTLRSFAASRRASKARAWRLFRAYSYGDRAVGREQAAELTFWEEGTSGQLEMIGTRGHYRFDPRSPAVVEAVEGRDYRGRSAFPVGANLEHADFDIDVVYTWVDGADEAWQRSFREWAETTGRDLSENALDRARFRSRDELLYSLRSIWAYAGWVRRVFVVTAGQRPSWLVDTPQIRVVDHSEILDSSVLPTFNSHVMESALHRIDGLSEHFVYFNDDFFLGRSLRPEFFFTSSGLPRIFHSSAPRPGYVDHHSQDVDRAAERGAELLRERFGRVATSKPFHAPYPQLRSVMAEIEREFPAAVGATQASRFRSPTDVSIAASFSQNYALATGRAVLGELSNDYVHVESGRLGLHLDRIRLATDIDTFCINETADVGDDVADRERLLAAFLCARFPVAAPWEFGSTGVLS
ncbi:MAG: stealth conserved region 3 domain-containing protein [Actinomycetota bacterium]